MTSLASETPTRPEPVTRGDAMPRASPRASRFEFIREIACGGMGRVIEAFDTKLERVVAIKEALDDNDCDARSRFAREVKITARLEHPSIVPVHDVGITDSGAPFYVMRKISGAPLEQKIVEATTLEERMRLVPHVLAVAGAIAHAHSRGVVHLDLKPGNIIIGDLGETVVIDWGLAHRIDDQPCTRVRSDQRMVHTVDAVVGTPGYMAPEQLAGRVDTRTDVFALGACLHSILSGKPPFEGVSEKEVLHRTATGIRESLHALAPGVQPDLVTIVYKAMAHDPAQRYRDADGFGEDLRRFLVGQPVAAHRYRKRQRFTRWLRRHRAIVGGLGAGLVLATAVSVACLRCDCDARHHATSAGEVRR